MNHSHRRQELAVRAGASASHQRETPWDAAQTAMYREVTLKKMESLGYHDIRKRIVYEKVCTPANWKSDFHVFRARDL